MNSVERGLEGISHRNLGKVLVVSWSDDSDDISYDGVSAGFEALRLLLLIQSNARCRARWK